MENPKLEIESSDAISIEEVEPMEVITVKEEVTASLQEIAKSNDDGGKTIQLTDNTTRSWLGQGQEDVLQWLKGVTRVKSDIEKVDGGILSRMRPALLRLKAPFVEPNFWEPLPFGGATLLRISGLLGCGPLGVSDWISYVCLVSGL